ncbi:uncharacterized protein LAESUDRAFT_731899 [Laetiporus sulphureus 93-53]|uniref:Uncharacterized protein n=1 Tax=Laetiporus sulphureus 93-53 TaxID=1314785 RepID=A0A165BDT9_9APHY|nr:uncharacterized protein LAESUDRAFT_731899 [Laetiporus sulphureus 93-53]KZT00828.1 hypothetical protein LAESUDRAFT_731899 [Laetiporus sulphureus 93-53]
MQIKVMIFTLLSGLRFEASKQRVVCNIANVQYSTVGSESDHAQLPLSVTRVKEFHEG